MVRNRKTSPLLMTLIVLVVVLLAAVLFFGGMLFNRSGGRFGMGSMMGGGSSGMMGGEMMNGSRTSNSPAMSYAQLQQLVKKGEVGATINKAAKTVIYTGSNVNLVALASPHGVPNMTWEIEGLVNPTITIPVGARIHVTLVNPDWGYVHGFEVTTTPPPYSQMPMMSINNDFLLPPLSQRTTQSLNTAKFYSRDGQLNLQKGSYYYLCPVPGHAQQGMYGVLKIS
ncbi:sulfocyanin-like copper-binding protein [Ferroacidibacillus organovorans]|uniref:Sulfocyanin-like C-terminal domain-containing protein n=1 Tax=Ferroacidibacillus organovorans TaxID=1765683 RepID=A0A101XQY4_9BACL|nr:sulfocyanin-like copper-binding protein [Ferroacidibacillus organovorans]KUO95906.1 hypothetical protein ATW55_09250 [Ferroacidibacillus organovorans]